MVTVGLMLAFMGITLTIWKPTTARTLPHFFRDTSGVKIGDVTATWHRIITVVVAIGIAVLLRWLLYRTRLGISMRAVVDSRSLAGLTGAKPVGRQRHLVGARVHDRRPGRHPDRPRDRPGRREPGAAHRGRRRGRRHRPAQEPAVGHRRRPHHRPRQGLRRRVPHASTRTGATPPRPSPPSSSSSPCCSCPQARLETGKVQAHQAHRAAHHAVGGPGRSALVFVLVTAWANGWIPWFGHQLRRALRRLARPRGRVHGARA